MKPKSKKYLVEETVKRTGLEESFTNSVLTFYWQHVRDFMQNPHDTSIFLNKLGTFSLSPSSVETYIKEKEQYLQRMDKRIIRGDQMNKWQSEYYIRCQKDLVWLKERQEELKQEKLKLKHKKALRNEYINKHPEQTQQNMEEQVEHTKSALEKALQRWTDGEDSC